jgi:hypothetical protein
MVDPSSIQFKVTVVRFDVSDHATYLIKIIGPKNISFHIRDRYSMLREMQNQVKNNIRNGKSLPEFPAKKMFGNLDEAFLAQRRTSLEVFLNTFLSNPEVKTSKLIPVYFLSKAAAKEDRIAIENLTMVLAGKEVGKIN